MATSSKPKNLKAWILALLAMLAGAGGADAAGYSPDLDDLKALGIVGAVILIAYLETRIAPLLGRIAEGLERAFPVPTPVTDQVEAPIRETKPRIAVVRPNENGRASTILIVTLGALAGVATVGACGWLKGEATHAASSTVDCATARAKDAIRQYAPTLEQLVTNTLDSAGHADWNTIRSATEGYAIDTGGCVLQAVVTRLLTPVVEKLGAPASSPLELDRADLAHEWDELRLQRYGGATFAHASAP